MKHIFTRTTDLMASRWVGVDTILCIVVWPIFRPTIRIQPPTTKLQNVWRIVGSGSKLKKCSQMLANRLLSDTFVNACVEHIYLYNYTYSNMSSLPESLLISTTFDMPPATMVPFKKIVFYYKIVLKVELTI